MFRQRGIYRTKLQNLRLAIFLSFVAGAINVIGFYHIGVLTTHVTGHFAHLAQALTDEYVAYVFVLLFYLASFLFGSFISNTLLEIGNRSKIKKRALYPVLLEIFVLLLVLLNSFEWISMPIHVQASLLIFSMGIQNALVTQISNATVRTTHLTGLFTDLGIELSQWLFYKKEDQRMKIESSIHLRLFIILFFAAGGIVGAMAYVKWSLLSMLIPIIALVLAVWYDSIRFILIQIRRRIKI